MNKLIQNTINVKLNLKKIYLTYILKYAFYLQNIYFLIDILKVIRNL